MPRLVVTTFPTIDQEPVTLAEFKVHARALEGTIEDVMLALKLQAARDIAERYCGRFFAPCTVKATYEDGEDFVLDPMADTSEDALATWVISGTDLTASELLNGGVSGGLAEYYKGISVSRDYPIGYGFTDAAPATYSVTYPVVVAANQVPPAVKEAILKIASDLYENRDASISGTIQGPLEVSYQRLLSPYRLANPFYQS